MAKSKKHGICISPPECLAWLSEPSLNFSDKDKEDDLRRAELRHSVLAIAGLDHVTETAMVRAAVKNVLGKLPEFEE
jgi:hypothetical protein